MHLQCKTLSLTTSLPVWHETNSRLADQETRLVQDLLAIHEPQNVQLVVQVAQRYTERLGSGNIIKLLESHKSYLGMYLYLGSMIASSADPEVCSIIFHLHIIHTLQNLVSH